MAIATKVLIRAIFVNTAILHAKKMEKA